MISRTGTARVACQQFQKAAAGGVLLEKVFFKKRPQPATLLNKRLWHRCFLVNFAKFLRALF